MREERGSERARERERKSERARESEREKQRAVCNVRLTSISASSALRALHFPFLTLQSNNGIKRDRLKKLIESREKMNHTSVFYVRPIVLQINKRWIKGQKDRKRRKRGK